MEREREKRTLAGLPKAKIGSVTSHPKTEWQGAGVRPFPFSVCYVYIQRQQKRRRALYTTERKPARRRVYAPRRTVWYAD